MKYNNDHVVQPVHDSPSTFDRAGLRPEERHMLPLMQVGARPRPTISTAPLAPPA